MFSKAQTNSNLIFKPTFQFGLVIASNSVFEAYLVVQERRRVSEFGSICWKRSVALPLQCYLFRLFPHFGVDFPLQSKASKELLLLPALWGPKTTSKEQKDSLIRSVRIHDYKC